MPVSSLSSSSARSSRHTAAIVSAALVLVGTAALIVTIVILVAGGFVIDAGPLHLSVRHWLRPASVCLVAWLASALVPAIRLNTPAALEAFTTSIERHALAIAIVAAASAAACGISYTTYAASGSDAAGYIAEAELLVSTDLAYDEPLARAVQWPDATATFAPLAFRPALAPGRLVPTYPPGLPLTILALRVVAPETAPFLVAPFLGAIAVLTTFLIARRIHSPVAGLVAAVLLASSPIFLFAIVQPMSDVPATGWWTLALALALGASQTRDSARRSITLAFLAGLAAGMAVLTRPNLLPLVVPILIAVGLKADAMSGEKFARRAQLDPTYEGGLTPRRTPPTPAMPAVTPARRASRVVAFLAGLVPGGATLALLQWAMYGSPLASGYGPGAFREFFSLANIPPNVRDYAHRLLVGELPAIVLTVLAIAVLTLLRYSRTRAASPDVIVTAGGARVGDPLVLLLAGFSATVLLCYLPYGVFPDWWYLRFLLPGLPATFSLAAIAIARAHSHVPRTARGVLLLTLLTIACSFNVVIARQQQAFLLRAGEARYQLAGRYLAAAAPSNAVIVTVQDSAAVHVYSHLPILRWDLLPIDLDAALMQLRNRGRHPLLLVEDWERPQLRARFPASTTARLDWAPLADFGDPVRVGLFDPLNRTTATDRVH